MFARAAICLMLLFFAGAAFAQDAKNRVALVIGNAAYKRSALANPVNDARLMAEKLKAQGFEVSAAYDAGQRDMKRAVQSFAASLRERGKDAVAFIFYAGHGVQVKGENYLIPVDEQIKSEGDVDIDAVSLSSIMSMLENTQTRLAIVVLDACRDNPFGYARGGLRGLARVDAPSGSLVAFSTAPGKAALDGPDGVNSHYTAAQAMAEPGLKIEEVFKKVRIAVREKTGGEQTPWESTSLTGDFYPAGAKAPTPAAAAATEPTPATSQLITASKPGPQPALQYEDEAQHLVRTFTAQKDTLSFSVAISPDARFGLSGNSDGTLNLWELSTGRELRSFGRHNGFIEAVAFSPSGRFALSGSWDKTLKLWDIASGSELRSFPGHTGDVFSVAISPDGRAALSGSLDKTLKLWDIASGHELRSFTGHTGDVRSVAFSPDGRLALSGSGDQTMRLWDIETGRHIRSFGDTNEIHSVAISPDGRMALSGGGNLKLWDIASGNLIRIFRITDQDPKHYWVELVAFTPDGRLMMSGGCNLYSGKVCDAHILKLWVVRTGELAQEFVGRKMVISRDGRFVLSTDYDLSLKLWDLSR